MRLATGTGYVNVRLAPCDDATRQEIARAYEAQAQVAPAFELPQEWLELTRCNLCGLDDTEPAATKDRYGLPVTVVQCNGCGLRYLNPRMSPSRYMAFYRHEYRALLKSHEIDESIDSIEADQWEYAVELSSEVGRYMPKEGRLLDLGGSTGIVGRLMMARFGGTLTVVDPSREELARARDCRTVQSLAEAVEFPLGSFEAVLLCRTIDHLTDPAGVLHKIRQWLVPGGVLIVDAMDVDYWPVAHRYKVDHPYAFTDATLRAMVADRAGFVIRSSWTRRNGKYVGLICSKE